MGAAQQRGMPIKYIDDIQTIQTITDICDGLTTAGTHGGWSSMTSDDEETRPYQIRLSPAFWRKVDEWRRQQAEIPARAEALRRLVEIGLAAEQQRQRQRPKRDS